MGIKNKMVDVAAKYLGPLAQSTKFTESLVNKLVINNLVNRARSRPHPLGTGWDYPCWDGLTNREYSGRHLPPAPDSYTKSLPPQEDVLKLFMRTPGGGKRSQKSTDMFANFAQWFTDGFLRTDRFNSLQNTSNHEIDISPLYGRIKDVEDALREGHRDQEGKWVGGRGRLRSQRIDGAEYPPFFFDQDKYDAAVAAAGSIEPNYDDKGKFSEAERDAMKARWDRLLDEIVSPENKDLLKEFGLLRTEREIMMADPQRLKNRFATGVERGNNQFGYVTFTTLFLREHNRLCALLEKAHPGWDSERLFQIARNTVIAMLIKIVIEEYINHIAQKSFKLKADPTPFYTEPWYRANWMTVEFNLLYRWHSLVPDTVDMAGRSYGMNEIVFNNGILLQNGVATVLDAFSRNAAYDVCLHNTNPWLVQFAERTSIRLGRECRLRPYNEYREYAGLSKAKTFADITSDHQLQAELKALYGTPDRVEYVIGLFAEDTFAGTVLPELITTLVAIDAFSQALTNPLLSKHVFKHPDTFCEGAEEIQKTATIGDIVRRNIPEYQGDKSKLLFTMTIPD